MSNATNSVNDNSTSTNVDKLEHLKMIQDIITRMANNSFQLKGWAITLVTGIFALSAWNDLGVGFYCLIYIPLIVFWFLDTYYLRQERLYRGLYNRVRNMDDNSLSVCNYSMVPPLKSNKKLNRINDDLDYDRKKYSFFRVMFSITEAGLYLPMTILVTIIIAFIAFSSSSIVTDVTSTVASS